MPPINPATIQLAIKIIQVVAVAAKAAYLAKKFHDKKKK